MDEKKEDAGVASSNGVIQQQSDDDDNDQDEDDLDEEDEDVDDDDDEEDNSPLNKSGSRHGVQQLHGHIRQNSTSEPSSPPPKKSRSELARFYEAAVKGRTLRSTAPGSIGQGRLYIRM